MTFRLEKDVIWISDLIVIWHLHYLMFG